MKKNTVAKVLGGALAGVALGAAAGMLVAPESGKKLRGDIKKKSADFYRHLAPQLKKMGKMGEAEYKDLAKKAMTNYGKAKKLSVKEMAALTKEALTSWKELKKHL
ncbi:MAG: YtxH domain-containing protein [Candidatus Harrisonbacteria bacterium]|nr:YtxH domain-containing protein [Candidatus Harrisonbacteria bacterium]